ncbi:MAG: hypothetical protein ACKOW8_03540 [Flavobacteriales bacterium]
MKYNIFTIVIVTILLTACVSAESETLKKARAQQAEMLKAAQIIDSLLSLNTANIDGKLAEMSQDTTLSSDSTKLSIYMEMRERSNFYSELQNELSDWRLQTHLLPENGIDAAAFPEGTSDADVLASIQQADNRLNEIKLRCEAGR